MGATTSPDGKVTQVGVTVGVGFGVGVEVIVAVGVAVGIGVNVGVAVTLSGMNGVSVAGCSVGVSAAGAFDTAETELQALRHKLHTTRNANMRFLIEVILPLQFHPPSIR